MPKFIAPPNGFIRSVWD